VDELTEEQQFLLARVGVEAAELSRNELIQALIACWEQKLTMKQIYESVLDEHNISFRMQELMPIDITSEEVLTGVFGYSPSDQEAADYVVDAMESATMELDMDEIVLSDD
jgi:hypothetical protein